MKETKEGRERNEKKKKGENDETQVSRYPKTHTEREKKR